MQFGLALQPAQFELHYPKYYGKNCEESYFFNKLEMKKLFNNFFFRTKYFRVFSNTFILDEEISKFSKRFFE